MAKKKTRCPRGKAKQIAFAAFEKHPRMSAAQITKLTGLGRSTVDRYRKQWNDLPLVAPSAGADTLPYLLGGVVIGVLILFVLIETGVL